MSAMSDWLERNLASHVFGTGTLSKPSTLALVLCASPANDTHTGATLPELANTGAYARQALNPSASNWNDPVTASGICANIVGVTFPAATADWGWVSGIAIADSTTHGAGNVWIYGALTTPKLIGNGDTFTVPVSGVQVTFA